MQSQKVFCWWQTDSFIYDFLKCLDFPWEWICFLFLVVFPDCPFCSFSIFLLLLFLNFLWNLCFFEVHLKVKVHKQKQLTMQLIIFMFLSVVETMVSTWFSWFSWFAVVLWCMYCSLSFGDCTSLQHQQTTHYPPSIRSVAIIDKTLRKCTLV